MEYLVCTSPFKCVDYQKLVDAALEHRKQTKEDLRYSPWSFEILSKLIQYGKIDKIKWDLSEWQTIQTPWLSVLDFSKTFPVDEEIKIMMCRRILDENLKTFEETEKLCHIWKIDQLR